MSEAKYYLISAETDNAFVLTDDSNYTAATYDTEGEAIAAAKAHGGELTVVRGIARITEVSKHKVERFK